MTFIPEINRYGLPVPKGAKSFFIWQGQVCTDESYPGIFMKKNPLGYHLELEHPYPVSQYSEQDAKGIVESAKTFGYRNYGAPNGAYQWHATAKESLLSLLKKYSLTEDIVLLTKK